jgi:hypothetical protein
MPAQVQDPLLHVTHIGDQLIVRRRKAPVRNRLLLIVTLERNGEMLAPISEIDHILVRQIRPEDDDLKDADLALVVALEDTRRFTIADSTGVPEKKQEIELAAQELATYVGVPIKQDWRLVTQWWLDQ